MQKYEREQIMRDWSEAHAKHPHPLPWRVVHVTPLDGTRNMCEVRDAAGQVVAPFYNDNEPLARVFAALPDLLGEFDGIPATGVDSYHAALAARLGRAGLELRPGDLLSAHDLAPGPDTYDAAVKLRAELEGGE